MLKNITQLALSSYNFIKDLIFPPFCLYCKEFLDNKNIFCTSCYNSITPIVTMTVDVTKKYKMKLFAISDYKDPIRALILSKGSSDIVAARKLGELLWELTYLKSADFDYIVPIELHWRRYASRGFNQAFEMAKSISKKSGKPVVNLLQRTKSTQRQSELLPAQRAVNLSGAFELSDIGVQNIKKYKYKKILLVDDLMTTGATLKSAAKVLTKLQPKELIVAVACRVI